MPLRKLSQKSLHVSGPGKLAPGNAYLQESSISPQPPLDRMPIAAYQMRANRTTPAESRLRAELQRAENEAMATRSRTVAEAETLIQRMERLAEFHEVEMSVACRVLGCDLAAVEGLLQANDEAHRREIHQLLQQRRDDGDAHRIELRNLNANLAAVQAELEAARHSARLNEERLEAELQRLRAELAALERKSSIERADLSHKVSQLERSLSAQLDRTRTLTDALHASEASNEQLRTNLDSVVSRRRSREEEVGKMEARFKAVLEEKEKEREMQQATIEDLRANNHELQARLQYVQHHAEEEHREHERKVEKLRLARLYSSSAALNGPPPGHDPSLGSPTSPSSPGPREAWSPSHSPSSPGVTQTRAVGSGKFSPRFNRVVASNGTAGYY